MKIATSIILGLLFATLSLSAVVIIWVLFSLLAKGGLIALVVLLFTILFTILSIIYTVIIHNYKVKK